MVYQAKLVCVNQDKMCSRVQDRVLHSRCLRRGAPGAAAEFGSQSVLSRQRAGTRRDAVRASLAASRILAGGGGGCYL